MKAQILREILVVDELVILRSRKALLYLLELLSAEVDLVSLANDIELSKAQGVCRRLAISRLLQQHPVDVLPLIRQFSRYDLLVVR